ncbi:hypothetical protein [Anabaena azotica]|uniref:Uncharacterized protein n=1 Tax=Anabaena azotica FACHB-119 TaxID=947527 RepID=A0ABR8D7T1_9NOST|nr:hypothetical protein [Anabaena azotica]MBD2502483.1 hypothetical protein [Anabaena azotica FACHB-119]
MFEVRYFHGNPITFSRQLIELDEFLKALGVQQSQKTYLQIVKEHNEYLANTSGDANNCENLSDESIFFFGQEKISLVTGQKRRFINSRQLVICIQQLIEMGKISSKNGWIFLQWYNGIVDSAIEQWYVEKTEEDIQDKLVLLAGYSNIRLRQEFTVIDNIPDSDKKTRRFDLVEFVNRSNLVRIREIKKHRITLNHVRDAIEKRCYIELASRNFPGKQVEFVFCSPSGIEEDASQFIDQLGSIYYEAVQDLGLRLYLNALKNRPIEGWTFFQLNVAGKFRNVLPETRLLQAAEERLRKQK